MNRFYCHRIDDDARGLLFLIIAMLFTLFLLSGCATNPVTGKNELMLISEAMELEMGQKNYLPARQMQGGDYVVNPEVTAYVREVGQKLAAVSDRKLPYEFSVLNNSGINAWAMPGGKLAINRGLLLKMDSEAELAAVLGHEIVHAAAKHGARQMQQALLLQGAMMAATLVIQDSVDDESTQALGLMGAEVVAALLNSKFSRDDERQSDHYGMTYMSRAGYDPYGAVRMQEVLLNESQGQQGDLISNMFSSHPPSQERININRAFASQLPAGKNGRDEYHQRLASLFKVAPAYAAYDEGQKAIKAKDYHKARAMAERAIRIEPREAKFHLLRGSALEHGRNSRAALAAYRQAVNLSPTYYEPHLRLGLLLDGMGHRYQAKQALENSVRFLKSASALQRLGSYALADGNSNLARQYLREASASNSPDGQKAYAELLGFDLPANAGNYLTAQVSLSADNRLQYVIRNNTPFPISNVIIQSNEPSGSKRLSMNSAIPGYQKSTLLTNRQLTQEELYNFSVNVISASLAK